MSLFFFFQRKFFKEQVARDQNLLENQCDINKIAKLEWRRVGVQSGKVTLLL